MVIVMQILEVAQPIDTTRHFSGPFVFEASIYLSDTQAKKLIWVKEGIKGRDKTVRRKRS